MLHLWRLFFAQVPTVLSLLPHHTLAQAWGPTTVPIMVKTRLLSSSRMILYKSLPNLAVPKVSSSTTMKQTGISNERQFLIAKIQSELAVHQRLAFLYRFCSYCLLDRSGSPLDHCSDFFQPYFACKDTDTTESFCI